MENETVQNLETENNISQIDNTQDIAKIQEEDGSDINWKRFRESKKHERKLREEAEKIAEQKKAEVEALKAALNAVVDKSNSNQNSYSHSAYEEENEDTKIQKKIEAALAIQQKRLEEERLLREKQEEPKRLAEACPDFNKICSEENLDYLEFHHPELSDELAKKPDGFEKWHKIYKAVKRYVPNPESKKDEKKAEKNSIKPQSMSAPGISQTTDSAPIKMDEKRRAENWARMQKRMKGI